MKVTLCLLLEKPQDVSEKQVVTELDSVSDSHINCCFVCRWRVRTDYFCASAEVHIDQVSK